MAFKSKDLSVLAYANSFTLWHYCTTDLASEMDAAGYFNDSSDMVRVGDMIMSNADTDGTISSCIYLVNANASGVVGMANMTATGNAA